MHSPIIKPLKFLYNPARGSFGLGDFIKCDYEWSITHWYACREEFHTQTAGLKNYFFFHANNDSKNLGEFLNKFESRLGLKKRVLVGETNRIGTCWVQPSPWWTKFATRRSLLTILLRAGSKAYNIRQDNFEEALYSDYYAERTRDAIDYFLRGNTVYQGCCSGWVESFVRVPLDRLHTKLVPEKSRKPAAAAKTEVARI